MDDFPSGPPVVRLERAFQRPFDSILTAARTCYSSKGIVRDDQLKPSNYALAEDLYRAGHHTTIQHAQFQFSIDRVSRHFLWSFLHSHPFYNSEQVSQRYVKVAPGSYLVPPLEGAARAVYEKAVEEQGRAYRRLIDLLEPVAGGLYFEIFPGRRKAEGRWRGAVRKRAMEVARYVLPVATFAHLYHTVSALTLLRYARLAGQYDVPAEQRAVVGAMVAEVLRLDPEYGRILEEPVPLEETPEHALLAAHLQEGARRSRAAFREEFDRHLDGRTSKMVGRKAENERLLADSVREVLGRTSGEMSDDDAIAAALDPSRNPILGESLNLTTHAKLSRCLFHPGYTFRKKLSHSADCQDQRHRMTPASRPVLAAQLSWREPDFVWPDLVRHDGAAERLYRETMERTWEAIERLASMGVPEEHAAYLLPNAVSVRFTESSDLLNLHHKMAMRLCYNAQEEIWRASVDEADQILEVEPRIGRHLLPPCTLRMEAGIRPWCPEGTRYCGVPVWNLSLGEYRRTL